MKGSNSVVVSEVASNQSETQVHFLPGDDPATRKHQEKKRKLNLSSIYHYTKMMVLSLMVGAVIFLELYFRHQIQNWVAGLCGGAVSFGMLILLALSRSARCVVSLLVPSLGTKMGKSLLVTLLTSMLLAGPAANLRYNFKETTKSLICFGEAAFNQTSTASERYKESMREMSGHLGDSLAQYVDVAESVQKMVEDVDASLKKTSDFLYSTLNGLNNEMNQCRSRMSSINGDCHRKMASLREECKSLIRGRRKKRDWLADLGRVGEEAVNKVKQIGSEVVDRVDDIKLTDVCHLFSTELCKFTADVCGGIKEVGKWTFSSLAAIPQTMRPLVGELEVGATYHRQLDSMLNNTGSFDEVKRNVTTEVDYFVDRLSSFVGTLTSYSSFITLVFVVVTSWMYNIRFRHSLVYDNIYINKDVKNYDRQFCGANGSSIFPLHGPAERKKVVDCLSPALSPTEKKSLLISVVVYIVVIILTGILILADWILYQVTDIIRRNGQTTLEVQVETEHQFRVQGDGFISTVFRFLFKEFNYQSRILNQIETIPCLPEPNKLSLEHLIRPAIVVFALGLATVLQPYCLRSRHAIAAHFYPDCHRKRIAYLYDRILRKRLALKASLPHRIPCRMAENEKVTKTTRNSNKLIKLLSWLGCFRRCCLLCGSRESRIRFCFSDAKIPIICNRNDCSAFYCATCWSQLKNCAVCNASVSKDQTDN